MKQRFVRLYDGKKRKHGIAAMAIVLCVAILTGTFVACTAKPASESAKSSSEPSSSISKVNTSSEPESSASKAESMVSKQVTSSSVPASSAPAPVSSAITGVIPKSFKSQLVTQTVEKHKYSIYVPAGWYVDKYGEFLTDSKRTREIGSFTPIDYINYHEIVDLVGNHAEFIKTDENVTAKDVKSHVIKALIRRSNGAATQMQGDTSIRYELFYYIISRDGTTANELSLVSNRVNTYPTKPEDENEKAVLQRIYKDTDTNEAMIQEILQSYSEK